MEVLVNLVCWQYFNILVRIITFLGNYYSSSIIFVLDNIFIIFFVMKMVFHVYRKVRSVQLTIQAHLRRSPKSIRSPPKKTSADETVDDECKRWTD